MIFGEVFGTDRRRIYGDTRFGRVLNVLLAKSRRAGMAPLDADRADKTELIAELEALRLENKRLRDRVVEMMLNADPLLSPPAGITTGRRKRR
jgi:hypothetical protein